MSKEDKLEAKQEASLVQELKLANTLTTRLIPEKNLSKPIVDLLKTVQLFQEKAHVAHRDNETFLTRPLNILIDEATQHRYSHAKTQRDSTYTACLEVRSLPPSSLPLLH